VKSVRARMNTESKKNTTLKYSDRQNRGFFITQTIDVFPHNSR